MLILNFSSRINFTSSSIGDMLCRFNAPMIGLALTQQCRLIHKGKFKMSDRLIRVRNTHMTLSERTPQLFGGRLASMRQYKNNRKVRGRTFTKDPKIVQFNVDVWNAQQTLRRKWKKRDWEVVEVPYEIAPPALQRVIPDIYTDVPLIDTDGDVSKNIFSRDYVNNNNTALNSSNRAINKNSRNIRDMVFDREEIQDVLYAKGGLESGNKTLHPYPRLRRVSSHSMTLEHFL
eukprot:Tbor_TRINITY_DN2488_c0_g2::TRINITY_DN2488_c0_g2_i2::g.2643::m.2643